MIKLKNILNESKESDLLAKSIDKEIGKIDDSLSYIDFAGAVVLTQSYQFPPEASSASS